MQAVFIDVAPDSAAIPAPPQGNPAGTALGAVKLDELGFLDRLLVQLFEHFFIIAVGHFPIEPPRQDFGRIVLILLW